MSHPFPPTALRRRHAQTVRDRASSYKIDYVIVIKIFLNPKGHQTPISGSKVTAIILKGWIWFIGKAPAACPAGLFIIVLTVELVTSSRPSARQNPPIYIAITFEAMMQFLICLDLRCLQTGEIKPQGK